VPENRRGSQSSGEEMGAPSPFADDGDPLGLRKFFGRSSAIAFTVDGDGDLGKSTERALIRACTADDASAQGLEAKADELRRGLAGPQPSALEALLIERIVVCWLQANHADGFVASNLDRLSKEQGDYHERRQDRAHRRLLQASKALASVRKMAVNLVVNIAEKQLNVMQTGADSE